MADVLDGGAERRIESLGAVRAVTSFFKFIQPRNSHFIKPRHTKFTFWRAAVMHLVVVRHSQYD